MSQFDAAAKAFQDMTAALRWGSPSIRTWELACAEWQKTAEARRARERRLPRTLAVLILWIAALAFGHGLCSLLTVAFSPLFFFDLLAVSVGGWILTQFPTERRK